MPFILKKKNKKKVTSPFVFTRDEVENLARHDRACYTVQNTTTRRLEKVGAVCTRKRRSR